MNPGRRDHSRGPQGGSRLRMRVLDPERVLTAMVLAGLTRRQLAQAAGWRSHTYLLRVLAGEVRTVGPEVAVAIAAAVGVGVDELFVPVSTTDPGRVVLDGEVA